MSCNHDFTTYVGFTETFDYCRHCDVKKSDIAIAKRNDTSPRLLKPGEMAIPGKVHNFEVGSIYEYAWGSSLIPKRTGYSPYNFIPNTPKEDLPCKFANAIIDEYQNYINDAVADVYKNMLIYGDSRIWVSNVNTEKKTVTVSSGFDSWLPTDPIQFGTNREPLVTECTSGPYKYKRFVLNEFQFSNDGQTWMANAPFEPYNTDYNCPQDDPSWMAEDDEPTLNITKAELQEALNAVGTTNGEPSPQLVEALWTALENT